MEQGNLLRSMEDPERPILVLVKQAMLIMEGPGNAVGAEADMKEALTVAEQAGLPELAARWQTRLSLRRKTRKGRKRGH